MKGALFYHGFRAGLGPFETREAGGHAAPSSPDCVMAGWGRLRLGVQDGPLRTGHVWVPPGAFQFTEGYAEARVRFPAPNGVHSAFWLQSPTPYMTPDDHEVDVAEHFGNPTTVHHSIWHRADSGSPLSQPYLGHTRVDATAWNVYGVDCRASGYTWTINGVEVGRTGPDIASTRPKALIASVLAEEWERPMLDLTNLDACRVTFDWVRVQP